MKTDKLAYLIIGGKIVAWVIGVIAIIMLLLKLLGHSPTADQLMVTLLGGIFVIISTLCITVGMHIGEVRRFMKESDRRFYSLASDFKESKTNQEKFNNWSRVQFQGIKKSISKP